MRLFILTPQLPYPPHQGTTIRNFHIIQCLAERHDISLLSFGTPDELAQAAPLKAACRRIDIIPYPTRSTAQRVLTTFASLLPDMALRLKSAAMHTQFAALLQANPFDIVQIEGIEMARFWTMYRAAAPTKQFRVVFDDHNAEYVLQRTAFESDARRIARWHGAFYSLIQWKKLVRFERTICESADAVVACSSTDAAAIQALMQSQTSVHVIPNGVDTSHFLPSGEVCAKPLAELALVFAGKMDFRPNIDAMIWFCDEILPLVQKQLPLAHLVIVGQKPAARVKKLVRQNGVQVTGWVPDTRPYISDSAVYVVPLRMGSGTRLKVLEAMAMGKAIVTTSRGVEGIDITPNREAIVADSAPEFADAIIALLRRPEQRRELGRAARALVEARYDWRAIVPTFEDAYH